jgi:diguanylate cyclase
MKLPDLSSTGRPRVYILTVVGTAVCAMVAFAIDGYSFESGDWRLGERWINNLVIPAVVAPPFFFFLLSKLRQLSLAHRELMTVASTDQLTNCLNRRAFLGLVEGYLDQVKANAARSSGAMLVLDVDHFKSINDRYGHDGGDEALKLIATTVKSNVRDFDLVARLGGEEFGVFLPGADPTHTRMVAERIRSAVAALPFPSDSRRQSLTLSVGGATFQGRPVTFSELFRCADSRLYAAKNAGRNCVNVTSIQEVPSIGSVLRARIVEATSAISESLGKPAIRY